MERNPYAPPTAAVSDDELASVPEDDDLASRLQRFGNYVIDSIIRFVLLAAFLVVAQFAGWFEWLMSSLGDFGSYILGMISACIYYVTCESVFGRTVGKLITGTRVVTVDGRTPRFLQIVGRTFARLIPFEAFSFFGALGVGWHDSFSNTRVIRTRKS